jgi:predicted site-specific integrase-resolvase
VDLDPQKAKFLNTRRAAAALGVAVSTMKRWRKEGLGPEYIRSETGRIRYLTVEVLAYREQNGARA